MYRFQIGDVVKHHEYCDSRGVIVKQLTCDEDCGDPIDQLDPNHPYYQIEWNQETLIDGTIQQPYLGFEHQESLVHEYVDLRLVKMMYHINKTDRELHSRLIQILNEIK